MAARSMRRAAGAFAGIGWPVLQGTAAATIAWVIAVHVIKHHQPFFAPIAAVIALNAPLGERGLNALRLLLGVVVGIAAAELWITALGGGYWTLALSTATGMTVAFALRGQRIVIAQSAASAILTVAVADGEAGPNRLEDALIGAGVALVFSQVLFSPEPVRLLRRAEAAALRTMAESLDLTARALEHDDADMADRARTQLRALRDRLADLGRTRAASRNVARRAPVWRSQMAPVVQENENAGQLDLLGGSCLTLNRTAMGTDPSLRSKLVPSVRELADALADLARDPGDRNRRQQAADRALDVARRLAARSAETDRPLASANTAIQMVAGDVMVFAGIAPDDVEDAVRAGTGELHVPDPAPSPRVPFNPERWRPSR
jgi:Fusaric acid resistance protein-like